MKRSRSLSPIVETIVALLRKFSSGYLIAPTTKWRIVWAWECPTSKADVVYVISVRHGLVVHRLRSSDPIFGYFSLGTANILLGYAHRRILTLASQSRPPPKKKASFQRSVKEAIMTFFSFFPFTIGTFPLFPGVNNNSDVIRQLSYRQLLSQPALRLCFQYVLWLQGFEGERLTGYLGKERPLARKRLTACVRRNQGSYYRDGRLKARGVRVCVEKCVKIADTDWRRSHYRSRPWSSVDCLTQNFGGLSCTWSKNGIYKFVIWTPKF